jgi:Ca2+-transporting ATPase
MDDNFATIVTAIEMGRSIYENIQKAIRLLFTANLAMVLLILAGLVFAFTTGLQDADGGIFLPLTAAQLLWINVITDGPPALALALDRNPGLMRRPPRPPDAKLLDNPSLRFIAMAGIFQALVGILLFVLMPRAGYSLDETRTAIFLYEASAELLLVYPARKLTNAPLPNLALHLAVGLGLVLQVSTLLVSGLRTLLQLTTIDAREIFAILAGVAVSWAVAEIAAARLRFTSLSSTH